MYWGTGLILFVSALYDLMFVHVQNTLVETALSEIIHPV